MDNIIYWHSGGNNFITGQGHAFRNCSVTTRILCVLCCHVLERVFLEVNLLVRVLWWHLKSTYCKNTKFSSGQQIYTQHLHSNTHSNTKCVIRTNCGSLKSALTLYWFDPWHTTGYVFAFLQVNPDDPWKSSCHCSTSSSLRNFIFRRALKLLSWHSMLHTW